MASALPDGEPAPDDGALPPSAAVGAQRRGFGVYVHVPFCAVRCGYCDFNTYTATELGGGADLRSYSATAEREIVLAQRVMTAAAVPDRPARTVFFGGGTPTLLPAEHLVRLLRSVRQAWALEPAAEVTVEANPDSVDAAGLQLLAAAGVTRLSLGMQSAVPHVLAALDRTHHPGAVAPAVAWARDAGLSVSLDLIYGTPGESAADWRHSLDAALQLGPDHVSAYALVVEPGTRMAARVARGELAAPDDDEQADRYEVTDQVLSAAGFDWYEVSNWARPGQRCRHNLGYWRGDDWWGVGPGAHSHVGGVRWWNVKHPTAYARRVHAGLSPAAGREVLDAGQRRAERVLLQIRTADGLAAEALTPGGRTRLAGLVRDGLLDAAAAGGGDLVLTRRGRLLADAVVRAVLD